MNEEKSISSNDGMCHGSRPAFRVQQRAEESRDSNEPVTTAAAGQTEAGDATAAAQEESGPKIFHDYMTTDVDTINPHI